MTPEGTVKRDLKDWLKEKFARAYYAHWPVLNGMGAPELDCNLIVNGYALTIECKAPGEQLTARQYLIMEAKLAVNGIVLVVEGSPVDYDLLQTILNDLLDNAPAYARYVARWHRKQHPHRYRDAPNG